MKELFAKLERLAQVTKRLNDRQGKGITDALDYVTSGYDASEEEEEALMFALEDEIVKKVTPLMTALVEAGLVDVFLDAPGMPAMNFEVDGVGQECDASSGIALTLYCKSEPNWTEKEEQR